MKVKIKVNLISSLSTTQIEYIEFLVLCGKIDIKCIPFSLRIADRSFYCFAFRHARSSRCEAIYDHVLEQLENDIVNVKDKNRRLNLQSMLNSYLEMKRYVDFSSNYDA